MEFDLDTFLVNGVAAVTLVKEGDRRGAENFFAGVMTSSDTSVVVSALPPEEHPALLPRLLDFTDESSIGGSGDGVRMLSETSLAPSPSLSLPSSLLEMVELHSDASVKRDSGRSEDNEAFIS